jgi:tetratricopeptide (TPR) repeat protein
MFTPPALLLALVLVAPGESAPPPSALRVWQKGQAALDADRLDEAVGHFQLALRLDPTLVRARLSLAAAHLSLGHDREAVPHLAAYLRARPEHFLVRMPYAEVLTRLERFGEARVQLERFVADVQENPRLADDHLIACHTRLMEISERLGDEYGERLHRGIGLHLLALKRLQLGGPRAEALAEEFLCKSAGELTLARMLDPTEARPWWYLHLVWNRLGQSHPARRSLHAAQACCGIDQLTPAERRDLQLRLGAESLGTLRR